MKHIFLFLLLTNKLVCHGQLKGFSFGAVIGTELQRTTFNYRSIDGIIQFNMKNTFSVVSGLGMEFGKFEILDVYEFPLPIHSVKSKIKYQSWIIPLMIRATFGKRIYFYAQGGLQLNFGMKAISNNQFSYEMDRKSDCGLIYGGGVLAPVSEHIIVFGEVRDLIGKQPTPTDMSTLRSMHSFNGLRILIGVAYQFNIKKGSTYSVSTYYPTIQKNN